MQSEHEFQEWCWRRARLVFAPICFLGILNIIFQSVFFPYIFYTLFWTLSPFVWIFQVPLILAFVVIYIIIWRREVFNFTTPAYLVLYTLLFLFTLLFGILLYAIPDGHGVGFFAVSSWLTAASLLVFFAQILFYVWRKKRYPAWTPSRSFLFVGTLFFVLFDLFLGFIYHPDVFTVVTFHFGVFGSHIFWEFAAEISLFVIPFVHYAWYVRQPSYLLAAGIDPKTQKNASPLPTAKLAYMYAWPLLFYALAHIFSITIPPVHCTNVFSQWTSDICVPSSFLGSWSFIAGLALLPLPLRMLWRYRPGNRAALALLAAQGDGTVDCAENGAAVSTGTIAQPGCSADMLAWAPPTVGERQPLTNTRSKGSLSSCCAWTWIIIAVILLPLLMLVVVIGTFPFTYYYTPGDTSAAGRWQYNEMTLVSGINMNASLDMCAASLGPSFSSLFLYVLRDQLMTPAQTARFVNLFEGFIRRPEADNFFDQWVALWSITDLYKLASPENKPVIEDAWNYTLAQSRKMGGLPKMIAEDTKIWLGDGDALVKLFARNVIVAPGNQFYRQSLNEPRFSRPPS